MDLALNITLLTKEALNPAETDPSLHNGYLLQSKVESVIKSHAINHPDKPMFLYYGLQLIHAPWTAPETYLSRCQLPTGASGKNIDSNEASVLRNYCALNVMVNEAIANLTCVLAESGMADNTILVISGDNGGEYQDPTTTSVKVTGNTYPFQGQKRSYYRGGLSNTALIHSKLIPETARGLKYEGLVHITDWLPTLMGLATGGSWTGSYVGADIDGVDVWDAVINNEPSPHVDIAHYVDPTGNSSVLQSGGLKYFYNIPIAQVTTPPFVFTSDLNPQASHEICSDPSLV